VQILVVDDLSNFGKKALLFTTIKNILKTRNGVKTCSPDFFLYVVFDEKIWKTEERSIVAN
jgi:hypothetical protein